MAALQDVAEAAGRLRDEKELARLVVDKARLVAGGDAAVLRWFDAHSSSFRLVAASGTPDSPAGEIANDVPTAISDAFQSGRPVIVNDYASSGLSTRWGLTLHVNAQIAVPLMVDGRALGTIAVLSFGAQRYRESDGVFLSLLAAIVAPALEAARLAAEVDRHKDMVARVYDALGVTVIVYDREGMPIHYNSASQIAFSNALKDPSGRRDHSYPMFHEDGRAVAPEERPFARALATKAAVRGMIAGFDVDDERRWVYVDAVPILDPSGEVDVVITSSTDITKLKRAEQRQREDADRLKDLIAIQTEMGSPVRDADSIMQLVVESAVDLTGAPGAAVQMLDGDEVVVAASAGFGSELKGRRFPARGNPLRGCIAGGDTQRTMDALIDPRCNQDVARSTGIRSLLMAPVRYEGEVIGGLQIQSPDKERFDGASETTAELLAGFAGAAISRARTATALRDSEHRVRAVIDSAPDPIVVFNADGGVVDLNPAAEAAFLRRREDVVGSNAMVMIAPRHVDAFHRWNAAAAEARSHEYAGRRFEATGRRADGTDFPMEIFITDLPEEPRLVAAFIRDLTLRDRLKESRERLASVVSSAPVIVLACDTAGTIALAEGSALSSLGLTSADAVGRNLRQLSSWDAPGLALIDRVLDQEKVEGRLHALGHDVYLSLASSPIRDDDGGVRAISIVLTDVTARVRAWEAERASEAKTRLMAMMNHEVRTPLNSILGFTHLLRDPQLGELSERQQRYVANIESSGNHLLELVNESLDMARLDIGRVEISLTDLPASTPIQQAIDQVRPLAEARGLTLEVHVASDLTVRADPRQLVQVLLNLLSNAVRHTPPGGSVSVTAAPDGAEVLIAVTDTGEGIAAEDQSRLFEEFFQAANHAPGGIGLGLAISRRLVHLMNGTIEVKSRLGKGSTFKVRLRSAPNTKA